MKKLSELYSGYPDIDIKDIKINSKQVEPGDIFVCTHGVTADRHDFIFDAISHGASAIVSEKEVDVQVPVIIVSDTNKELPILASKFYDYPESKLELLAVTGTNGKTTVAGITKDLIGDSCGYLGTNGLIYKNVRKSIVNTTPDSDRLYKYFDEFVKNDCKYVSIETSSEAFFRKRLENLKFKVAAITNITEDHLNIHKTIENYVACKMELLKQVSEDGVSILNIDDEHYLECRKVAKGKVFTYGMKPSTMQIKNIKLFNDHTEFIITYNSKDYNINSPLLGEFNCYNLCCSMLTLIALDYDIEDIIKNIGKITPPSGRVQLLDYNQNYKIILDYAHTPDAFRNLYSYINKIKVGKVITVTGSAGGRETEKRGPMGKMVLDNSDLVIFTTDDPRNEDVNSIIDDLISESNKTNYKRIIDRKEAIDYALSIAKENDIVLIAGKGTDNYMALGNEYLPYSDLEVIEDYFK